MRKTKLLFIIWLLTSSIPLTALADGEQVEGGSVWVDPVEFFHLQDITTTDLKRDYDQGDIDINKVLKKSGEKIYGLRIKPVVAAGYVEEWIQVNDWAYNNTKGRSSTPTTKTTTLQSIDYIDDMGFRGVPVKEAGFCIYFDESVSRSYDISYKMVTRERAKSKYFDDTEVKDFTYSVHMDINNLTLALTDNGIGFNYTMKCQQIGSGPITYTSGTSGSSSVKNDSRYNETVNMFKPAGIDDALSHFIYFKGDNKLFLILSTNLLSPPGEKLKIENYLSGSQLEAIKRPWARMYFEVEEIMVKASPDMMLSKEDKEALKGYMDNLFDWLKDKGDELGLGEHSDEKESMVINTISILTSILLGTGLGGFIGGSGAAIAESLTGNIIGGGGESSPWPDTSEPPSEGMPSKRPDEEDTPEEKTPTPNPDDLKLFHSTDYPELCERYIHEGSDGTVTVTDPATGVKTEFYPTEDGKWVKYYGQGADEYTSADLEERVRFSVENSEYVLFNANKAAQNLAEQRAQRETQLAIDRARGYSDEMKEYRDIVAESERKLQKEQYLDKLAMKYSTTVENLTNKIKQVQEQALEEKARQEKIVKYYDKAIKVAEVIDKTAEVTINIMGECVPGGRAVKNAYTFLKSTCVAASEAYADGMELRYAVGHVALGMNQGILGVIQNQAGDLTKNPFKEYGIVLGTEALKEGLSTYEKKGNMADTFDAMLKAGANKTMDFLTGKMLNFGMNTLKDSASQALNPSLRNIDTDTGLRFSDNTANKINKWFNSELDLTKNTKLKGWNLFDEKGKFSFTGTSNVTFGGKVDLGNLITTSTTELLNQTGAHGWAGTVAGGLKDDAVGFVKDLMAIRDKLSRKK